MLGIVLGLCSALTWGLSGLVGTRATRLLGTNRSMAWSTITGFAVVLVPALLTGPHSMPGASTLLWLATGALGSMFGLWTMMLAYRHGALSVVAPIIACQGVVIAVVDVVLGNPLGATTGLLLVVATLGAAIVVRGTRTIEGPRQTAPVAVMASVASAICFGIGLYAAAVAADDVGPFVPSLVTRVLGLLVITAPMLLIVKTGTGPPRALRWALVGGTLDVGGMLFFVGSAQAGDVSVAGVLASQSAAISTVLGLLVLHERMTSGQRLGFAMIIAAVTALAAGV
jgi:drug/metabolite transporter (DMT)-like permease